MKYSNIREEELKNKIAKDYFNKFDATQIIGNIDFSIYDNKKINRQSYLWAESKKGQADIFNAMVQLILTIGKARTFDSDLPPKYLGAFNGEKIIFIPYHQIDSLFYQNDFNWNVAPSKHDTKEFKLVLLEVKKVIDTKGLIFDYLKDDVELKEFIKRNFIIGATDTSKIQIDKNNFIVIYNKWLSTVKPSIGVEWENVKRQKIIDGDFYLADLLSRENETLKEKLFVLLKKDIYELDRKIDKDGFEELKTVGFKDGQKAHTLFWNKYKRPPKEEYWEYITDRRDLLVPQDIRERKGSFYTPQQWVELSQAYLTDVLGENWQDEYTIWDLAAGTGNLLNGLTNKYNIWASTIDQADVDVMKDRIQNGAHLLPDHVFQFDFLNDNFSKLPKNLKKIIDDREQRKKLVIYINPPYAEVSSKTFYKGKPGVNLSKTHEKYSNILGTACREIYIMFLAKIYDDLKGCQIGEFSKLKIFQGSAFDKFRIFFKPKLEKMFIAPAYTFDNVKGKFPIGFKIWNTNKELLFNKTSAEIFDENSNLIGQKKICVTNKDNFINKWISKYKFTTNAIGFLAGTNSNDFQSYNSIYILNLKEQMGNPRGIWIDKNNLIIVSIYLAVRKVILATWINDRDQFLHPNDKWQSDKEFQNDCLAYTLFHSSNNIQSRHGTNHWLPFTEQEVQAKEKFDSHFMTDFIGGKLSHEKDPSYMLGEDQVGTTPLTFSPRAKEVFEAGRALWIYYHSKKHKNVNASLYDIREHFQGRNQRGKMNNKSLDKEYMYLIKTLREKLKILGDEKIVSKVYEYGFLKK